MMRVFPGVDIFQWYYDSKLYSNLNYSFVSETWLPVEGRMKGIPGSGSITPEGPGLGPPALDRPLESDDGAVPWRCRSGVLSGTPLSSVLLSLEATPSTVR